MKNQQPGAARQFYLLVSLLLFAAPCAIASEPDADRKPDTPCPANAPCAAASAGNTEQLIAQGQRALATGQPEEAALIFERVLLEQPWRLGVWLDYALSLQQMGDLDSARAIYRNLLQQDPPAHLVPWLQQQARAGAVQDTAWRYAGKITLQTGHDSNLNRAPETDSLTLTMPAGGQAVLYLSDTARISPGASQLLRLDWQALRQEAGGSDWLLQAAINTRIASGIDNHDYTQTSIGLSYGWSSASGHKYHTSIALQNLHYGGQDIQRILRGGMYRGQYWQPDERTGCSVNYGAEWEMLAYPHAAELDGQYLGVAAELGCKQGVTWQAQFRTGVEQAEHQRPGGDQWRAELRGQLAGRIGDGAWASLAELAQLKDAGGYSPLLENNAARTIRRGLLKLEYQHPLGARLYALASAEAFRQHSNLPLFATRGQAAWLGVRYLF